MNFQTILASFILSIGITTFDLFLYSLDLAILAVAICFWTVGFAILTFDDNQCLYGKEVGRRMNRRIKRLEEDVKWLWRFFIVTIIGLIAVMGFTLI